MRDRRESLILPYVIFKSLLCTAPILATNDYFSIVKNPMFIAEILAAVSCLVDLGLAITKKQSAFQISSVIGGLLLNVLTLFVYHIIAVLYGAPLYEAVTETFHLSLLLTSFTTVPCSLIFGPHLFPWVDHFTTISTESQWSCCTLIGSLLTIIGAWIGAFPIPLDWDRPWQVWPISCLIGAMIGHIIGLTTGYIYYRTTAKHDKSKII